MTQGSSLVLIDLFSFLEFEGILAIPWWSFPTSFLLLHSFLVNVFIPLCCISVHLCNLCAESVCSSSVAKYLDNCIKFNQVKLCFSGIILVFKIIQENDFLKLKCIAYSVQLVYNII